MILGKVPVSPANSLFSLLFGWYSSRYPWPYNYDQMRGEMRKTEISYCACQIQFYYIIIMGFFMRLSISAFLALHNINLRLTICRKLFMQILRFVFGHWYLLSLYAQAYLVRFSLESNHIHPKQTTCSINGNSFLLHVWTGKWVTSQYRKWKWNFYILL